MLVESHLQNAKCCSRRISCVYTLTLLLALLCQVCQAWATPTTTSAGAATTLSSLARSSTHRLYRQSKLPVLHVSDSFEDDTQTSSSTNHDDLVLRGGDGGGGAREPMLPTDTPPLPTFAQYRRFVVPCLGLWVSGPLLSLVDTAFVGLGESSSTELAALGPATNVIDGATYLFAFLNVATTNLYSAARAQHGGDSVQAESVVRTAAQVSIKSGLGLMLFLLVLARPMLQLLIGTRAAATPGLVDAAVGYVQIRALSMPTSLLLGVLQAALLGSKDSVTPLIAVVYATVVNVIGDYLLVRVMGDGLRGAAIATTLAQWVSMWALLRPARRKLVRNGRLNLLHYRFKKSSAQPENGTTTARAFLKFAAPVLTLIIGKISAFGFMTNAAAGVPNQPIALASHQIILSLLFFCSPFLEVISQTAQTFLPPFLAPIYDYMAQRKKLNPKFNVARDPSAQPWFDASMRTGTQLLVFGLLAAGLVASTASLIPALFGNWITSDPAVQVAVKPLAKYLWMGAFFWAPVAVGEGILLARRELSFLASVYLATTALLPPALLRMKFGGTGSVGQVWALFAAFQLFRAACFSFRIWGGALLGRRFSARSPNAVLDGGQAPN